MDLRATLISNIDEEYKKFSMKLIPDGCPILGIRMPILRKISKSIIKNNDWHNFLDSSVSLEYMEERMVYGQVVMNAPLKLSERIEYIEKFLPLIDSWAVCDQTVYKPRNEEKEDYFLFLKKCLESDKQFIMRFGIVGMMKYIDDDYIDEVLSLLESYSNDGYYFKMGVAWAISICFIHQQEKTLAFLNNTKIDDFTYNKSLQKIRESYRVNDEMKEKMKEMKRK